jgi:hypothetical protein
MRFLRALLTGLLAVLFSGVLVAGDMASATPSFYQFDNGNIRIGAAGGQSSIVSDGNLAQPWVYNASLEQWRKLTYRERQLETLYGAGGTGTNDWNYNGTRSSGLTGVTYDFSEFVELGARGSGSYGYGTITATGTRTLGEVTLEVTNSFSLGQNASYLKVTTTVTNSSATTATNLRVWTGAPDDWIGDSDGPTKTRGYLTSTEFLQIPNTGTRAPALKITAGTEGVVFFSTNSRATSSVSDCCDLSNAASADPATNSISLTGDGSYTIYMRLNDLAQNDSDTFDWYYAAGEVSDLGSIIREVAQAAAAWTDQTIANSVARGAGYSDQVMASGTGTISYGRVDPSGTLETGSTAGLPPFIELNPETGALTGTAPANAAYGIYVFRVQATATSDGTTATSTTPNLTITVGERPNIAVASSTETAAYNVAISAISFANNVGFPAPIYSVSSGSLPAGVTIDSSTGTVSGTPTESGQFTYRITASNDFGSSQSLPNTMTVKVRQVPMWTDSTVNPIAPVGRAYSDGVAVSAFPLAAYAVTAGSMPPGLNLNATTGAITGTANDPGEYAFTVTASNIMGGRSVPLTIAAHEAPGKPIVTLAPNVTLGEAVSGNTAATGYPNPTFYIAGGSLPDGVSINRTTGRITGVPTQAGNFTFTVGALNDQGSAQSSSFTLKVLSPSANIDIAASVGDPALGAAVKVQSEGLKPTTGYTITVRSTPQIVASGNTTRLGQLLAQARIPDNLEPGWHSITLDTLAADGSRLQEVAWFELTATGLLETVSEREPSASEKANALTDDAAFYEDMSIDPGTQVEPEEVAGTVQEVSSVIASVALVSAAAAATAAVASAASAASVAAAAGAASASASAAGSAASAGGSASSSAAGARTATPGTSSSAGGSTSGGSSSGGSGGSSSSGSGSGGASGDDSADYGNLEADHDDFTVDHVGWGDALAWWSAPAMTALDRVSVAATEYTSRVSPVLSRIINDGAYLRAMVGGAMVIPYAIALLLGAIAVDTTADSIAAAGSIGMLSIILILGTLDAFAGLIGILSFTVVSVSMFGIHTLGDVRYLLAMFIAGFAPIILSTTFRKIRRPKVESLSDVWERVIDVFMIAFVASLTTLSVVGGISAFAGATVPLADNAKNLVWVITGVALTRILLEEFAARSFSARLDSINPTEVSGPGSIQQWVSLVFKYAVLVVMIGDMVGWGWWLWTGALIMFVPGIMGMTLPELPKSKLLTQLIPGGLAALLLATLLSTWSGEIVGAVFAGSELYGPLSFLLVPLPVIIVAIVGMFAAGGEKWYIERNLKWVYIAGGVGVFVSTVWATDFIGQISG